MPFSSNSGKKFIKKIVANLKHDRMLDVGCGSGTYPKLFPEAQWDGIEVWKPYIQKYNLKELYITLYNEDVRTWRPNIRYDIAIAGDILEHMTPEEAKNVLEKLKRCADTVIVSIPIGHYPQDEYQGNPYEKHVKDDWSDKDVKSMLGHPDWSEIENEIGVYVYSRFPIHYEEDPLKIAIYTICKNEEGYVNKWAESNKEADLRIVCDTGSNDNTIMLLNKHGVKVYQISVNPWRFDIARNCALNLLPEDIDVCIWQDLDEVLLPGWRMELEKNWKRDVTTTANHRYRNNNNPWQWHSKIHARHNCHWIGAVHETLKWTIPENSVWLNDFYLDEKQDVSKNRTSYLPLLLKKIEEGDKNWRTYSFLGNEYESIRDMPKCIETRLKSYDFCDDGDIVKSYISKTIARNYAIMEDDKNAEKWFQIGTNHSSERETWFSYAEYLYTKKRWDECYVAAKRCLEIQTKRDGFTQDPRAWGAISYDLAALSAFNVGLKKQALEWGEKALELQPGDARLIQNLNFYKG